MLNNIPTTYNGILYQSKGEAIYAKHLDELQRSGEILSWRRQIPFYIFDITGKSSKLIVDFLVTYQDKQVIHEFKRGFISDIYLDKLYHFTQTYPYTPYLIVEQTRQGYETYTPQELLEKHEYLSKKAHQTTNKKHSFTELILSSIVHHLAKLISKQ